MKTIKINIDSNSLPDRLDKIIKKYHSALSRRHIKQLISRGGVFLNKKRIRKASYQVIPPATIEIHIQNHQNIEQLANHIHWHHHIIYHGSHIIAVNKPPGIPTAPTVFSMIHNVYHYLKEQNLLPHNFYPFHRLDKDTSGVLLIPLSRQLAASLNDQIKNQQIKKRYLAICKGNSDQDKWTVKGTISRQDKSRNLMKFTPQPDSQEINSLTEFEIISNHSNPNICCISAFPYTGKTHQIRLHLAYSKLPILGDKKYNPNPWIKISDSNLSPSRMMLHCREMTFYHPFVKDHLKIKATLPEDFKEYFQKFFPELLTNKYTN